MTRRELFKGTLLGTAATAAHGRLDGLKQVAAVPPPQIYGQRFVTLCIMIRTTPWEVSRNVELLQRDESAWHTVEGVRALREAFAIGNPEGALTWGFTLNALEDKRSNYEGIRAYAIECHKRFRDEISYFPEYFPAMYLPRERIIARSRKHCRSSPRWWEETILELQLNLETSPPASK